MTVKVMETIHCHRYVKPITVKGMENETCVKSKNPPNASVAT
jgi:hypothetical protein